ncbi:MAG: hypothetical protein ACTSQE_13730 [Candidatus Heimdallarchaeaceae archaeon]
MSKIQRYKYAKMIRNGGNLILFFYFLLLIFSNALLSIPYQGFNASFILYIPIIVALIGIGLAAKGFEQDSEAKWVRGKRIFQIFVVSSSLIFLSFIFFTIQEVIISDILEITGLIAIAFANLGLAFGFYLLKEELEIQYENEKIIKKPDNLMTISFFLQALAYVMLLISYIQTYFTKLTLFDLLCMILAVLSLILMVISTIKLNVSFRAYPYLFEEEILHQRKR